MSWLYVRLIPQYKKLILSLVVLFGISSILSFAYYYTFWEANTFVNTYSNVSFVLLSVLTLFSLLKIKSDTDLKSMPVFYLLIAFLAYYTLVFFKGIFVNYLVFQLKVTWEQYWPVSAINLIANISKNFLLFYVIVLLDKGYKDPLINRADSQ